MKRFSSKKFIFQVVLLNLILSAFVLYEYVLLEDYTYWNASKGTLTLLSILIPICLIIICLRKEIPFLTENLEKKQIVIILFDCILTFCLNIYPCYLYYSEQIRLYNLFN